MKIRPILVGRKSVSLILSVIQSGLFLGFTWPQAGWAGNVYVCRFWHCHQPIYWPEWNSNPQPERVQFAQDSINLKSGQVYDSGVDHPENDLVSIFSVGDRINAYQSGPRNSLANVNSGGYAISYSGSLINNVASLGAANSLGYGSGWWNGNREARNWTTSGGSRKLDLVGFTYHHSLGAVLPKEVFRKEIQIFKEAYYKAWNTGSVANHSKGFFPTEMAFSQSMIDVLADEGYQWTIVASHHLSRTLPSYMGDPAYTAPEANSWKIFSSPPNAADQLGNASGGAWWFGTGNVGETARNYAPYAYQLHKAQYVNPDSGAVRSILLVPSDDIQSYKAGYSGWQKGLIDGSIAPYANDSARPCLVMPATDGDNAWGGGSSSWDGDAPGLMNNGTYPGVAIQDFVNQYGGNADTVHIEDGAWIFPETDYGSPYFLKWVEPPVGNANRVPNTQVDIETPGFSSKFYSWAPVIAGANWCQTAEQMTIGEGGSVQAWKIQDPYDNLNSRTYNNPNPAERAWHIFLAGLDSGFNYYGGLGNDDEIKTSLATRRAYELLNTYVSARKSASDQTPPTVFKPQRFPYNPGAYTFGWFNSIPGGNTSFLKKMNSEFYVWTFAYDVSGIANLVLKIRKDNDGVNPLTSKVNEVYDPTALGLSSNEVGSWVSIPMTKRTLPSTAAALTAAANNSQIQYFSQAVSPVVADYYFAKIDNTSFPNFRNHLFDYYIEATDARGNVSKSDIQHVFVADDAGGTGGGGGGGGTTTGPVVTSPSMPVAGQPVTIIYTGTLASGASVNIHHGYNGGNWTTLPGVPMTKEGSAWKYTYTIPSTATNIAMVFNFNGQNPWDNNGGNNYNFSTTNAPPTNPPSIPAELTAQGVATNAVSLSWSASVAASGYTVYRDGNLIASVTGTSHLDTGCQPDTTYRYTVTADNVAGSSAPSLPASATTYFTALSNYSLRVVNPGFAVNTTSPAYVYQGQAGLGLTNGIQWSNSLNGQTGFIPFTGLTNSSGWAWSNMISLGQGSNRLQFSASYQPLAVVSRDSATNSSYAGGWTNGSSGGSGFGPWNLSNTAIAGFFIAGSAATNMNVNSSNGFGLYANSGGVAQAKRNLPVAMKTGDLFSLRFDNNWVSTGSQVGMALANSSGSNRFSFYFVGGQTNYWINDARNGTITGVPYSSSGWLLNFELTGSNSYRFTAGTNQITGNLGGDGAITQLVVTNNNAGPDTPYNLYLGDMTYVEIQPTMVTQLEAPVVFYNPMTQGIPDSWWSQYFGTTSGVSASADSDGDGFTNLQESALGTNPMDSSSTFNVKTIERNGNSLTITWSSVSGKKYQVQATTQLNPSSWQDVGEVLTANSGLSTKTVNVPADAAAYFVRVNLIP
jgi:hypothetical protein